MLLPFEAAQVSPFRRFFFSDQLDEAAPTPLIPEGTIASFSTYRDLAAIWKAAPDLFTENIATQFAQAESQLSNFFGGRSFGVDVLGGLTPRFQFLIVRRQFDEADSPVPKIKLPAAALVMRARNAKLMTPVMQLGFQTIVGIVNIQAAMGGQPALILTNESLESGMLATAAYIPPPDGTSNDGALIHNFSPSMAIVGDYVILTTARPLAEQLIALASATREPTTIRENTLLQIDAPAAVAALRDNRETLIAQNMIQQGASREQSERAIDVLLELLTFVRNVDAKILTTPQTFRIELGAQFQGE